MGVFSKYKSAKIVRPFGRDVPDVIAERGEIFYLDHDGVRLRVFVCPSDRADPRGTLIVHPGRTEFIEKYFEAILDFHARGFTVVALDPRGQGLSDRLLPDRLKCYVKNFQEYSEDLAFVIDELATDLPKPHVLLGHSMGGVVVLQSVISGLTNPSAVVCSAPMLGLFDVQTPAAEWFVRILTAFGLGTRNLPFQKQDGGIPVDFKGNKLTTDLKRFRQWAEYFETTPELRVAGPTFAWVREGLRAMSYVNRNAKQLKIPGLMVAAGGDPIVDPASNERFAEASGMDFHIVPGALHEVLMEKDSYRTQFFDAFDEFLERQAL